LGKADVILKQWLKYKSDLQMMFCMLKYRNDKRGLLEYTKEQSEYFKQMGTCVRHWKSIIRTACRKVSRRELNKERKA